MQHLFENASNKMTMTGISSLLLNIQSSGKNFLGYESIFRQLQYSDVLLTDLKSYQLSIYVIKRKKRMYLFTNMPCTVSYIIYKFHTIRNLISLNLAHFYVPIQTTS